MSCLFVFVLSSSTMAANDLATVAGVQAYIVDTPFDSTISIWPLSGGYGNYAYRLTLSEPFREQNTVVLKHAKPYVAAFQEMAFSLERQVCAHIRSISVSLTAALRHMRSLRCVKSARTYLPTRSLPCRRCSGSTTPRTSSS